MLFIYPALHTVCSLQIKTMDKSVVCEAQHSVITFIKEVNSLWPSDVACRHRSGSTFGSGNSLLPDGTKPLPEPMWAYHQ